MAWIDRPGAEGIPVPTIETHPADHFLEEISGSRNAWDPEAHRQATRPIQCPITVQVMDIFGQAVLSPLASYRVRGSFALLLPLEFPLAFPLPVVLPDETLGFGHLPGSHFCSQRGKKLGSSFPAGFRE